MAYYVQIDKPREFRRDVLEGSKRIIASLQQYRNVLYIREKKKALLTHLKTELKELTLLIAKLDKIMPEKQLRVEALKELKEEEAKKESEKKAKKAPTKKRATKKTSAKKTINKKTNQNNKKTITEPTPKKPKTVKKTDAEKLNESLAALEQKLSSL